MVTIDSSKQNVKQFYYIIVLVKSYKGKWFLNSMITIEKKYLYFI